MYNFTGRGQLRFANLNGQICEDCEVLGEQQLLSTCALTASILSNIDHVYNPIKHVEIPKCLIPANNNTHLLRERYNIQELVLCINPKQCNRNHLFKPAQTRLGEALAPLMTAGANATLPCNPWLTRPSSPIIKVTPESTLQLLILSSCTPTSTDPALLPATKKLPFQLT